MDTIDRDFEALWKRAIEFEQDMPVEQIGMLERQVPDDLLPQGLLQGLSQIADRCYEQGLIDRDQRQALNECHTAQRAVFDAVDPSVLRSIMVSFQTLSQRWEG